MGPVPEWGGAIGWNGGKPGRTIGGPGSEGAAAGGREDGATLAILYFDIWLRISSCKRENSDGHGILSVTHTQQQNIVAMCMDC